MHCKFRFTLWSSLRSGVERDLVNSPHLCTLCYCNSSSPCVDLNFRHSGIISDRQLGYSHQILGLNLWFCTERLMLYPAASSSALKVPHQFSSVSDTLLGWLMLGCLSRSACCRRVSEAKIWTLRTSWVPPCKSIWWILVKDRKKDLGVKHVGTNQPWCCCYNWKRQAGNNNAGGCLIIYVCRGLKIGNLHRKA